LLKLIMRKRTWRQLALEYHVCLTNARNTLVKELEKQPTSIKVVANMNEMIQVGLPEIKRLNIEEFDEQQKK